MEGTLEELRRISNCPEGATFSQLGLRKSVAFLIPEGALRGCREGSESRLAEVDAGRNDRRRVYRGRDDEPGPSAAASRRRISSANVSPETDHCVSSRRRML